MARLAWLLNLAAFVFVAASGDETSTSYRLERQSTDPNIFGVSSFARITSRNGRISSSGGVHFYPGPGATSTDYSPLTFTKAINRKYATGSVQIHPGALGVSSSAQAGYIDPGLSWPMDWPRQWNWPVKNQFYALDDPWARIKLPQTSVRRQWMYPSFNPFFNIWR